MREPDHWAWRPQLGPQQALVRCPIKEAKLRWRMPNGGRVGFGYLDGLLAGRMKSR